MQPADASKEHNCIPDEHYVQTLLAVSFFFSYSSILSPILDSFYCSSRSNTIWILDPRELDIEKHSFFIIKMNMFLCSMNIALSFGEYCVQSFIKFVSNLVNLVSCFNG